MNYIDAADQVRREAGTIKLHGPNAFAGMRRAGKLAAEALDLLAETVRPGITTGQLDQLIDGFARDHGAHAAPLLYRGYPHSICTSINHVVCHGMPSDKPLREGDILNIDVTLILDGWHGDSSRMYTVGKVPVRASRLSRLTHEALLQGIAAVKPGNTTRDIGVAIQRFAENQQPPLAVVEDFCGHGLGLLFHDEPNILHYAKSRKRWRDQKEAAKQQDEIDKRWVPLRPGMIFTIEPMLNLGKLEVEILKRDGWTAVTRDGSLSAQFEHSVGVTETGVEIFTLSPRGLHQPPYDAAGA